MLKETGLNDYLLLLSIYQTRRYKGISFLKFLLSGQRDIDAFCAKNGTGSDGSRSSCTRRVSPLPTSSGYGIRRTIQNSNIHRDNCFHSFRDRVTSLC